MQQLSIFTATADWQFFTAHSQEKLDTIQIWIYVFKCIENKGWQAKEETLEEKKNSTSKTQQSKTQEAIITVNIS